jgi:hypothetical protein
MIQSTGSVAHLKARFPTIIKQVSLDFEPPQTGSFFLFYNGTFSRQVGRPLVKALASSELEGIPLEIDQDEIPHENPFHHL